MVAVTSVNRRIRLDIRYATTNNFTGQAVYPSAKAYLRKTVAAKLGAVQTDLESQGLGLKVWDAYRPLAVQKKFWAIMPDERYVADPAKGSRHNRGSAVDVTLVRHGFVPFPTEWWHFDDADWASYDLLDIDLTTLP
ncbi:MAG: M15 family metallopeptidase [Verrucomicrobia bacterium]|nr:M15 family metallopeptidase [Verrucomicrobiota bacterium]MBU4247297.1 M15 family metallopeptidase [Verrucomicrobiota bacterium]MBU4289913.1 M15 family metallopeptidase [Verrucomicrobiota bacterium]MBU4428903.1 M15 family metallopeptidase [Verrucomicrobiota bacterium]MBU4496904.1 M15 family metallopeptidase [Verrucomicrobiota bacterium]